MTDVPQIKFSLQLYDAVKRGVNLADFLSNEIGCNLIWREENISASTICPLPSHKDSKPSFNLKYAEESKAWIFKCFGCGAKGSVIDFCMEYYGMNSPEAVLFLCNKYGINKLDSSVLDNIKDIKQKVKRNKKINCAHIVASRQCFSLLKQDYEKHNIWVKDAYKNMNKALDNEDLETIESISFEANRRMEP